MSDMIGVVGIIVTIISMFISIKNTKLNESTSSNQHRSPSFISSFMVTIILAIITFLIFVIPKIVFQTIG